MSGVPEVGGSNRKSCDNVARCKSTPAVTRKKRTDDPVLYELCSVFCAARNNWHTCKDKTPPIKCKRPSKRAEEMLKRDKWQRRLGKALEDSNRYPRGTKSFAEKPIAVPWDKKLPGNVKKRKLASPDRVKKILEPARKKLIATMKKKVAQKVTQKAATAWMKFVPVLNVISTAYDIYDLATTGYDLYKMVDEAMAKYKGTVYEVRPDVLIEGPDGKVEDIYDFKFDDPQTGYQDKWATNKNPSQKILYDEAVSGGGSRKRSAKKIDQETCECSKSKRDLRKMR